MDNKFTIIVPTRERADTLVYTIRSLLDIKYENLEIIISDNASMDNTKDVIDSFDDKRLTYIQTGKRVSMNANWEFALTHVDGGYVSYIGDDDAFLPESISEINNLINRFQVDAVTWKKVEYCWPNHIEDKFKNYLSIPLKNEIRILDANIQREKLLKFSISYNMLPCLYNSFVNYNVIKKAIDKKADNSFFNSLCPDIYSGIVISYFLKNYIYSYRPFSVNGASKHSGGTSYFSNKMKLSSNKFLSENTTEITNKLVLAPSMVIIVAIEFYNVAKIYGFKECNISLNIIVDKSLKEINTLNEKNRIEVYCAIEKIVTLNKLNVNLPELTRAIKNEQIIIYGYNKKEDSLNLRADMYQIVNVYDAAKAVSGILPNYNELELKAKSASNLIQRLTLTSK
ncbi:MAG: glycosyltransferase family 2 protein [Gammaproteobacteria bacterium]|nr:glycosyltransferase family 2 protein [Gammaproteobacteria bacterium]